MVGERDSAWRGATAVVVAAPERRTQLTTSLDPLGLVPQFFDDPYTAMAALCNAPEDQVVLVLSLSALFREELLIVPAARRLGRWIEIWLADFDGRSAVLAEAMRLGIDALLGEEGLHRLDEAAEYDTEDGFGLRDAATAPPHRSNGRLPTLHRPAANGSAAALSRNGSRPLGSRSTAVRTGRQSPIEANPADRSGDALAFGKRVGESSRPAAGRDGVAREGLEHDDAARTGGGFDAAERDGNGNGSRSPDRSSSRLPAGESGSLSSGRRNGHGSSSDLFDDEGGEPILTPDELRALLQEPGPPTRHPE